MLSAKCNLQVMPPPPQTHLPTFAILVYSQHLQNPRIPLAVSAPNTPINHAEGLERPSQMARLAPLHAEVTKEPNPRQLSSLPGQGILWDSHSVPAPSPVSLEIATHSQPPQNSLCFIPAYTSQSSTSSYLGTPWTTYT